VNIICALLPTRLLTHKKKETHLIYLYSDSEKRYGSLSTLLKGCSGYLLKKTFFKQSHDETLMGVQPLEDKDAQPTKNQIDHWFAACPR